jgi:hypothetical protein
VVRSAELSILVNREEPSEAFHAAILQFILYLFDCCINFQQLCASPPFLYRLVDLMFPQGALAATITDQLLLTHVRPHTPLSPITPHSPLTTHTTHTMYR